MLYAIQYTARGAAILCAVLGAGFYFVGAALYALGEVFDSRSNKASDEIEPVGEI